MMDLLERAKTLLKATTDLLEKQEGNYYVLNLLEETVFYDGAVCRGSCLKNDIGHWFDELEEQTKTKPRETEEEKMSIAEAIICLKGIKNIVSYEKYQECLDMVIRALEMQEKLSEFSGMDICKWVEDYDDEDNDISQYDYETSVDNFLIDEADVETEEEE